MVKSSNLLILCGVIFALIGLGYGSIIGPSTTIIDDGAISLRYAERISEGKGFTYNDGEAVYGASNPLYTLLLAGVHYLIKDLSMSVIIVGACTLAITLVAAALLFLKYQTVISFLIYLFLFSASHFLLAQYFLGLEQGVTCALITLVFLFLYGEKWKLLGISLGLLVANKLDGGLGALAFALVFLIQKKRFPLKTTIWAVAGALPVALVLLWCFGTVIPQSMTSKLVGPAHAIAKEFDHLWMAKHIYAVSPLTSWLFIISLPGVLVRRKLADFVLLTYFGFYLAAYSGINLGGQYPWYSAAGMYLMILSSSIYWGSIVSWIKNKLETNALSATLINRLPPFNSRILGALAIIIACLIMGWNLVDFDRNRKLASHEKVDLSRAAAGAWLRKVTSGSEVLYSPWGLPAFEYKGPTYDPAGLTSSFDKVADVHYFILPLIPRHPVSKEMSEDEIFADRSRKRVFYLVATFRLPEAFRIYALYARQDSELYKKVKDNYPLDGLEAEDFSLINDRQRRELEANNILQLQ